MGILLFLPLNANADCHEYDGNAPRCRDVAGCYYSTNFGECWNCPSNSDIYSIGYYCPQNGMCDNGEQSPDGRCLCPSPFNLSTLGNDDVENCYAPCYYDAENPDDSGNSDNYNNHTKNCGLTYGNYSYSNPAVSCINNEILTTWDTDETYHIEVLGGNNYGCYLNDRPCNLFSTEDHYPEDNNLDKANNTGTAIWIDSNNGYDITNCRHISNKSDSDRNCMRRTFSKPYYMSTVSNAQGILVFNIDNITDINTCERFFCTECLSNKYYPRVTSNATCKAPDTGTEYKACKCDLIPQGHYNTTGIKWTFTTQVYSNPEPNHYTKCPAGKTTDTPGGAVSEIACHYGDDTQICDSAGCVNLSDLGAPESWTDL